MIIGHFYLWPSWHGSFIDWKKVETNWDKTNLINRRPKQTKIYWGECSHGTAWQFRIDTRQWSWYIVLRNIGK